MGEYIVVLVVVLVIVLLWRGPKTLPKLGSAFGKSIRDFRREVDKDDDEPEAPDRPA